MLGGVAGVGGAVAGPAGAPSEGWTAAWSRSLLAGGRTCTQASRTGDQPEGRSQGGARQCRRSPTSVLLLGTGRWEAERINDCNRSSPNCSLEAVVGAMAPGPAFPCASLVRAGLSARVYHPHLVPPMNVVETARDAQPVHQPAEPSESPCPAPVVCRAMELVSNVATDQAATGRGSHRVWPPRAAARAAGRPFRSAHSNALASELLGPPPFPKA